jgi:hypothetical protein
MTTTMPTTRLRPVETTTVVHVTTAVLLPLLLLLEETISTRPTSPCVARRFATNRSSVRRSHGGLGLRRSAASTGGRVAVGNCLLLLLVPLLLRRRSVSSVVRWSSPSVGRGPCDGDIPHRTRSPVL